MKEFVYYGELFNIYSFLLTAKQKEIFSLYFEENLSLSALKEYIQPFFEWEKQYPVV